MPSPAYEEAPRNRRSEAEDRRFGGTSENPSADHRSWTAACRTGRKTLPGHRERPGRARIRLANGDTAQRRGRAICRAINRAGCGTKAAAEPRGQAIERAGDACSFSRQAGPDVRQDIAEIL